MLTQFVGVGPIGDLFRVDAGPIQIREIQNNCTNMNGVLHSLTP